MTQKMRQDQKKRPNPPRLCIFCGGAPISKEHLWARWMRDYLPEWQQKHTTRVFELKSRLELSGRGMLDRRGDARGAKLKIVCESCNNGWMSELQNSAKPVLLPLITGDSDCLESSGAIALTNWAFMFALVFEQAQLQRVSTSTMRSAFMIDRVPPETCRVWVAPFADDTAPCLTIAMPSDRDPPVRNWASYTILGAGQVCLCVFFADGPKSLAQNLPIVEEIMRIERFVPIWPRPTMNVTTRDYRLSPLTWNGFLAMRLPIANAIAKSLSFL